MTSFHLAERIGRQRADDLVREADRVRAVRRTQERHVRVAWLRKAGAATLRAVAARLEPPRDPATA